MDRTRGQHFFGMLASFPELHPARSFAKTLACMPRILSHRQRCPFGDHGATVGIGLLIAWSPFDVTPSTPSPISPRLNTLIR